MQIATLIIMFFLLLFLNCCGQLKTNKINSYENTKKNKSIINLGLNFIKADLILKGHDCHPIAFSFGEVSESEQYSGYVAKQKFQYYELPTGKVLLINCKNSENGFIVSNIFVSSIILNKSVGKADPERNAFWDSFKPVKIYNLERFQ